MDYEFLCRQVGGIDPEAEYWMREYRPKLPNFNPGEFLLAKAFRWVYTPQGRIYWSNIHSELEARRVQFEKLVKQVSAIDASAGHWLRYKAEELPSFHYTDDIAKCFDWWRSPQGHTFWRLIEAGLAKPYQIPPPDFEAVPMPPKRPSQELWWEKEKREKRSQLEATIALRNEVRKMVGQ